MRARRAPLCSKMPSALLATSQAFVAECAQTEGPAQGLAGVGGRAGGPGHPEPHPLWNGNYFSNDVISRLCPPGSQALGSWSPEIFMP